LSWGQSSTLFLVYFSCVILSLGFEFAQHLGCFKRVFCCGYAFGFLQVYLRVAVWACACFLGFSCKQQAAASAAFNYDGCGHFFRVF
jgi:hypothetical protein